MPDMSLQSFGILQGDELEFKVSKETNPNKILALKLNNIFKILPFSPSLPIEHIHGVAIGLYRGL